MGTELTDAQLAAISQLSQRISQADGSTFDITAKDEAKAPIRKKALRLLDQRSRSKEELRQRLLKNEDFAPPLIEEVLDTLEQSQLIDDWQFASEWVRQRSKFRGKSRSALDRELSQKGIAQDVRRQALAQITVADESAIAQGLAEKKVKSIKVKPSDYAGQQKDLRKVVGVLARRGFNQSLALDIAKTALARRYEELS